MGFGVFFGLSYVFCKKQKVDESQSDRNTTAEPLLFHTSKQKISLRSVWHGTFFSLKNCMFLFVKGPETKITPEDNKEDDVLTSHQPAGTTR